MTSGRLNRNGAVKRGSARVATACGETTREHCIHSKGVPLQRSHLTGYSGQNSRAVVTDPLVISSPRSSKVYLSVGQKQDYRPNWGGGDINFEEPNAENRRAVLNVSQQHPLDIRYHRAARE